MTIDGSGMYVQGYLAGRETEKRDMIDHERVILEGIANGITNWFLSVNPLYGEPNTHEYSKNDLDWLLDRLTKELDERIPNFEADKFVYHVRRECGLE